MILPMQKRWIVKEATSVDFVPASGDFHPIANHLLWHRNVREPNEVTQFFNPSYDEGIHDPFLFRHMRAAVDRLFVALTRGEKIVIFGDYDADGITGSAALIATLREIENRISNVEYRMSNICSYIPHRDKEGYGLRAATVQQLVHEGARVIVTVDCGIACVDEIAVARSAGVDVIVVDHHQFGETLPDAILIHPSVPGETYPFKSLAAVGVAWKLACGLIREARTHGMEVDEHFEKRLLDLVSIATITDIVPLLGENRVLEQYGLRVLNKTNRPGLRALIRRGGLRFGEVTERDVGFAIGPRINAAGRMEHASLALALLLAATDEEAEERSAVIEQLNRARQAATSAMMEQAERMLMEAAERTRLHVLWHDTWSPALVGLVAGRVADRFGMPAVVIGKHGDQWIGSGRSLPSYDITAAVKRVGEGLLTRSGGHVQACGFSLAEDRHVPMFAERLREDAERHLLPEDLGPALEIDAELALDRVDWSLVDTMRRFAPFGCANTEPVFMTKRLAVTSSGTVGQDSRHLRFTAADASGRQQKFIAFNFGKRLSEAAVGSMIDVAYTVSMNEWNGNREIQCKVVDFRPA
jgi:single-stranded-DNA-specific exonuclease